MIGKMKPGSYKTLCLEMIVPSGLMTCSRDYVTFNRKATLRVDGIISTRFPCCSSRRLADLTGADAQRIIERACKVNCQFLEKDLTTLRDKMMEARRQCFSALRLRGWLGFELQC